MRFLEDGVLHIIDDRMQTQPWGVAGGKAGAGTTYILNPGTTEERRFSHKIDALPIKAGDRLMAKSCGGGGWGDPLRRGAEPVADDVALGLVSQESAASDYGVELDATGRPDKAATEARRRNPGAEPTVAGLFDRGLRYAGLEKAGRVNWTVEN